MNTILRIASKVRYTTKIAVVVLLSAISTQLYSQAVTVSGITGGVAPSPVVAGTNDIAILGVQLAKAGGGANTITALTFAMSSDPNGKFTNARLYSSADNTFGGIGSETFVANGTINTTDISFSGAPLTDFGGGPGAATRFFFLVVNVDPGVTGLTTAVIPSLPSAGVAVSASTASGSATGISYAFAEISTTIALLTTGVAPSPLQAGATGLAVFGFSLTSNASQTVTALNIQAATPIGKWNTYSLIKSTDNSFSSGGDNTTISSLTFTPSATEIVITGLTETITTSASHYFLVANVDATVNAGTSPIQPSLGSGNVTATGNVTGSATGTNYTFVPLTTIALATTGVSGSPLIRGATNQAVFGFSLTSSGTQTVTVINIPVTSDPAGKWSTYSLVRSTDNSFTSTGDNTAVTATITPSATQIAIAGALSQNITTTPIYYFLVVTVETGATGNIQPSLGAANLTLSSGAASGTATGTNFSFVDPTLTFTQIAAGTAPVIPGVSPVTLSAGATLQVLAGFSVTSNGSQTITAIDFDHNGSVTQFLREYLYKSTTAGTLGSSIDDDTSPDGNFNGLTEVIQGTLVYYYWVVDVANSVTNSTASVTTSFSDADVTVTGNKSAFAFTNRSFNFGTSQLSAVVLNGGTTNSIPYINFRSNAAMTSAASASLANFQIRDGDGVTPDGDNKPTILTDLQLTLTNHAMVKKIGLFDGSTLIQEKTVSGSVVDFDPLNISTSTDGGTKDFQVRAVFQNTVTDNAVIRVEITSVSSSASNSVFEFANGGGAITPASGTNDIEVVATILNVPASISTVATNTPFGLTVQARDTQNNLDLDFAGQVGISVSSGPGAISPGSQTLVPILSSGQFAWSDLRLNISGSYTLSISDDSFDNELGDGSTTITISSPASTISPLGSTPPIFYGIAYQPLSNIVITETDPSGISGTNGNYTFSISLPAGFVFNPGITSGVSVSGSDLSGPSGYSYPSTNVAQFSVNLNGTSNINSITIANLQIGHPHPGTVSPGSAGGNITRAGGTLNIAGVNPGVVLGSVSASQATTPPSVSFTVAALSGDVAVEANTTSFNVNSNPVNLVGSQMTGTNVFTGSGITLVSPNYRFNPSSLPTGNHIITYTHTNPAGSQFIAQKTFVVFTSGINGLDPSYCTNDPTETGLTVDQTFINQRSSSFPSNVLGGQWIFDYFVYYDINVNNFVPLTSPAVNEFDPDLPAYASTVSGFGGRIPVGFAVCNPTATTNPQPCFSTSGVRSNVGVFDTYQWVIIKQAPNPSIVVAKSQFCADDAAVDLIGVPANSNNTSNDLFSEIGPGSPISSSGSPVVWSYDPSDLGGAGSSSITYTYTNPSTGCTGTSAPVVFTVNTRPGTVLSGAITSLGGTTPETCAGTPIGTFTATPLTAPDEYRWYSNSTLSNFISSGNSLTPPSSLVNPNVASVTNLYVTQLINGCESNKQPVSPTPALPLTVTVKAIPSAPTANFTQNYCIGDPINPTHFQISGGGITTLNWYLNGVLRITKSLPNLNLTLSEITTNLGVTTATQGTYVFQVTQTVNGCEGVLNPTLMTVNVRPLPVLTIASSDPDLNFCKSDPVIVFSAFDNANPAINGVPPQAGVWSGVTAIVPNPVTGEATLNPALLAPGPYALTFTYTNSTGCSSSRITNFTILPTILPSLAIGQACVAVPVNIQNTSTIDPGSSPSTIVSTSWTFGDGGFLRTGSGAVTAPDDNNGRTTGTYFNPLHRYTGVGTFPVSYTMVTSDGCTITGPPQSVVVSQQPQINFKWENPCRDGVSSTVFTASEGSTPALTIQTYNWNFNTTGTLPFSAVTGATTNTPTVNYSSDGRGIARLIVETAAGCRDTIQKPIYIVSRYTPITETTGYDQGFEVNADGWLVGGENPSWALGNLGAPANDNNATRAWKTNLNGGSNVNESSWVLSRCFDFSQATRPVFSFDIWSNTAGGSDGAVLQYNSSGNIEDESEWVVIGDLNQGLNWYNSSGIINSPGNQSSGDKGWSGTFDWQKSIFAIDPLTLLTPASERQSVVFRIAYASAAPGSFNGFSFDNVQVAERSRIVLVESFTNSSAPGITAHNNLYNNFNRAEVVRIQYHTAFPGADPINDLNPVMHNSRSALYGIVEPAAVLIDGSNTKPLNAGTLSGAFDNRVLTPSAARLNVSSVAVSPTEVDINVTLENTSASSALPVAGARLFVVVLDSVVNTPSLLGQSGNTAFTYVASDMLPSPTGILIQNAIAPNTSLSFPPIRWNRGAMQSVPRIAVFVQRVEGNNKSVFQAILHKPTQIPSIVTGVEPLISDRIHIYPNPADRELTLELPAPAATSMSLQLIDQLGRVAFSGTLNEGEQKKTISTENAAGGMYFIQIGNGKEAVRKKVLVVHRE